MKYRVTGIVTTLLLVTLLFCACAAEPAPAEETVPTETPTRTETEALLATTRQVLEQSFDSSGILAQDRIFGYDGEGNLAESAVTSYDAAGNTVSYLQKAYDCGILTTSLSKHYRQGCLIRQVEVFYFPDGSPRSVSKWEYSESGTLLHRSCRGYSAHGDLISQEQEDLIEQTGFRVIRGESFHENGKPAQRRDGIYHGQSLQLLDGKSEIFDENGSLIQLEEALWDAEQQMSLSALFVYGSDGETVSSLQIMRCYDSFGHETVYEATAYEGGLFAAHFLESRSFDTAGQLSGNIVRHYKEDGTPAEQYVYTYRYDSAGNLIFEQKLHELTPGVRQNLTVTEYIYDGAGNLTRETQTGFDNHDAQKFQTVKEFDSYGNVSSFLTVSNLGNRYTYSYAYDESGQLQTELLTTVYRSGTRIDYQETSFEYHENGNYKTVSVHKWTSHDEAKYPDAPLGDLGKTTVTEYDEDGNKIQKP